MASEAVFDVYYPLIQKLVCDPAIFRQLELLDWEESELTRARDDKEWNGICRRISANISNGSLNKVAIEAGGRFPLHDRKRRAEAPQVLFHICPWYQ